MNLNAIVSAAVTAVNAPSPVAIQVSSGNGANSDMSRTPQFQSLASFVGSIAGKVLTVASISSGALQIGQAILGAGIAPATLIMSQIDGTHYALSGGNQTIISEAMTSVSGAMGQIQNLTYRELMQIEGLNLGGVRKAIYLNGRFDGVIRLNQKGGDLVTFADGTVWLTTQVSEYWPAWCRVVATLQNGS